MTSIQLSDQDAYVLARAMSGLETTGLPASPVLHLLLQTFNPKQPDDYGLLQRILREGEVIEQVLKQDPLRPLDKTPLPPDEVRMPALPATAQLSSEAVQASSQVGNWVNDFMTWAVTRSPMTPPSFLQAGAIWTLGLAIARRCCIHLHAPIYPHLYILWIAPTSTFKKTTGMDAVADLVNATMPPMLLPEESTPEAFVAALAGQKPPNYDRLSPYEQKIDDAGRAFCAQRGILLDEASSLIGASRKDYMQGLLEMLLRLYDAPPRYTRNVRTEGKTIIREASLCILGATTPAALIRSANANAWETGEFARYAMLYPEQEMAYNPGTGTLDQHKVPSSLAARLLKLHTALPKPPDPAILSSDEPPKREKRTALMDKEAHTAYAAYAKAITFDLLKSQPMPDQRLHPNYARLHVQAVKVALSLAAIDWADNGATGEIRITLGHWAAAQHIAENWRASLHRLLSVLDKGEEIGHQDKILAHLEHCPEGVSLRELSRNLHLTYKAIETTLKVLIDAGLIIEGRRRNERGGPEAKVYKLTC